MHYHEWCSFSEEELATRDIALTNLCASFDTPTCPPLDVHALCRKCDDWASIVEHYTKKALKKRSQYAGMSEGEFRMMALVTVLQRDLGVTYNMAFLEGDGDASNPHDMFLHGLLNGHGGTCVTLPVLYTAIGRRLGYPLFIVHAREHRFCRWEGQGQRFNVEAAARGFLTRTDEHYHREPKPLTDAQLRTGIYLRNLTRKQELAAFLSDRAFCGLDNFDTMEAMKACHFACELDPTNSQLQLQYAIATLVHRFLQAIREQAETRPYQKGVYMPKPKAEWERQVYPEAFRHLNRILANRKARQARTAHKNSKPVPSNSLNQLCFSINTSQLS